MAFEMMEDGSSGTIIKVIGIGGAGGNAVNTMIRRKMRGSVDFIVANTDRQALAHNEAGTQIQLGSNGLGAGGKPEVGASAANEAREAISNSLKGADMVFITAGMGGGTGTGAAPIVAEVAQELGILSVGVVTRPFTFEGSRRKKNADGGIQSLKGKVNSLIVILNDQLEKQLGDDATMIQCFEKADEILYNACAGIAETIEGYGQVHRDFHDVQTVLSQRGAALMGMGEAEGPDRAIVAAEQALSCPLLEGGDCTGAKALLVNFTCSKGVGMKEIRTAMEMITNFADPEAEIFFGTINDESMGEKIRINIIAAGIGEDMVEEVRKPFTQPSYGPFASSKHPEPTATAPKPQAAPNPFSEPAAPAAQQAPMPNPFARPPFQSEARSPFQNDVETPKAANSLFTAEPVPEPPPIFEEEEPRRAVNDLFASERERVIQPSRMEPQFSPQSKSFTTLQPEFKTDTGLWGNAEVVPEPEPQPVKAEKRGFLDDLGLPKFLRKKQ